MFDAPLKNLHGLKYAPSEMNSFNSEERQTEETPGGSSSSHVSYEELWGGEGLKDSSEGSCQGDRGGDDTLLDSRHAAVSRLPSLDYEKSPPLRRSLFNIQARASRGNSSTNSDLQSGSSICQTTSRPQTFLSQAAMTATHPALQPPEVTVGLAAPFLFKPPFSPPPLGSSAASARPPRQAMCAETQDKGTKRALVSPMMPQPLHIQGSSNSGVLRPVSEIPVKFRSIFSDFPFFNYVQSKALDDVLYSNKNFVA
ncbi:uncharacterized protein hfm1, partial [Austrofundulus limnaeus]|uniref:Uncharacterized protein hfm1 n=1 Tax=Austrofundulus limnaeus TaxID=52670 RepID=A0A2I4CN09_AUSLI